MSGLLGGAGPTDLTAVADDKRALSVWFRQPFAIGEMQDFQSLVPGSYRTSHWPGGGDMLGDAGDVNVDPMQSVWYCEPDLTRGASSMFGITGTTRDAFGQPLSFVTVKLYKTSSDQALYTTTSNGNGAFLVQTSYYPDAHYIVFYKAGSPDIFATTQNTLIAG